MKVSVSVLGRGLAVVSVGVIESALVPEPEYGAMGK